MKSISLTLLMCTLFIFPGIQAQQDKPKGPIKHDPSHGYYRLEYDPMWKMTQGQGYIELRGKGPASKAVGIRVYALGLRSLGGKFKDLEHVVNDMIFQVRDEFKGKVSEKTTVKVGKDNKITARHLTGSQPSGKGRTKMTFYATEHPTQKGVIISFSFSGPSKLFDQYLAEAQKVLATLELKEPGAREAPALPKMAKHKNPDTQQRFELPEKGWKVEHHNSHSMITGPKGMMAKVQLLEFEKGFNQAQELDRQRNAIKNQKVPMRPFHQQEGNFDQQKPALPMTLVFFEPDRMKMRELNMGIDNLPTNTEMLLMIFDEKNSRIHLVHFMAPNRLTFNRNTPILKHLTHSLRLK